MLARMAYSTSAWKSSGTAVLVSVVRARCSCGAARSAGAYSATTVMRFSVRVPVLSTHNTVAAPRVSIAAMRRVSTCCCASRHAPSAGSTVSTTVNSCGNMAMASAMPASSAASQSPRVKPSISTRAALVTKATSARLCTSRAVCPLSGDRA